MTMPGPDIGNASPPKRLISPQPSSKRNAVVQRAGVVELVDAPDSKSGSAVQKQPNFLVF
jgi:hypothetical protein